MEADIRALLVMLLSLTATRAGRLSHPQQCLAVGDLLGNCAFSSWPLLSKRPTLIHCMKINQGGLLPNGLQLCFKRELPGLVDRLNNNTWPWFGNRYSPRCRNPNADWPRCYNPRPENKESVLGRIIVHLSKATHELEVIFSAPSEMVDVCGKSVTLPEVKPFKLNDNGFAIPDLLKQGAEIYRRMPIVKWNGTLTGEHSLLFMDAGFVKVRGYMGNITTNGTHLLGEVLWPYTPPANPNHFRNPIVIVLWKQTLELARNALSTMSTKNCMTRDLSKGKFQECFRHLSDFIGGAQIKGVQVFYTDGSSKYEKYRCCVEGSFCDAECISDFKSHAQAKASSIQFTTVSAASLDMYVNLEASSTQPFNYTACCHFFVVDPYTFRGVPGDNNLLDDTVKLRQAPRVEFSGSGETALDTETLYSVLMVDPDVIGPRTAKLPYGLYWTANLKYQDHYTIGTQIMAFEAPSLADNTEHTIYILLYSYKRFVEVAPTGFFQAGSCGRCGCDFSKLPADHKLRGISWFKAKRDNFTLQWKAGNHPGGCAIALGQPGGPPCGVPNVVQYSKTTQMAIKLAYDGNFTESADPINPDYDYDDSTGGRGNVLGNCETLWLIVFCVRVLEEIHV